MHGLGASDMKGGLAVMVELGHVAAQRRLAYDLALLFFPREELGPGENPLPGVFAAAPLIDEAALVICLEPTDNTLQLGCLGNINARVVFEGKAAHSARPWLGTNAIRLAFEGLRDVLVLEPHDVSVAGLIFREVLSLTQIDDCGNAANVIPARVECTLNFRYAPNRTAAEAEARLRELVPLELQILHHSPAAHVAPESPLLAALRAASGSFAVEPKQAWTNVADFAARGLDAVNLGPGSTRYARLAERRVGPRPRSKKRWGRDRSSGRATRTTRPAPPRPSPSTRSWRLVPATHGFVLCSDEAYSELWFDEPPASALQVADRTNVVVFNTLSKRSSMTGYRCGFVCAPRDVCDALRAFRPSTGTAPQEFVQRAGIAALADEQHVEHVREV